MDCGCLQHIPQLLLYYMQLLCLFLILTDLDRSVQQSTSGKSFAHDAIHGLLLADSHSHSVQDTSVNDDRLLTHRMQVFRMRLLHFVNSLHDYIMTRVSLVFNVLDSSSHQPKN